MNRLALSSFTAVAALVSITSTSLAGDDPFADVVISYNAGASPNPSYTNPAVALGSPERMTAEIFSFPSVVSVFNSPYGTDELLSISAGGQITVKFNSPVTNDPNNLYGIDLLVFGNTSFEDLSWPDGIVIGVFNNDGGTIEVSADGFDWRLINGVPADGFFPMAGFVDSAPYDEFAGRILTDFTRPVDPTLTLADFMGLTTPQIMPKYRGSGGGTGVDIGPTGLSHISFVRLSVPANATENIEIDAVSDVSPRLPGDVNLDGLINVDDLLGIINAWGAHVPGGPPADFDLNGFVNVDDLLVVINHWTS